MKAIALMTALLAAMLSASNGSAPGAATSARQASEIVAKRSAKNRAVARRDANRRLGMISLPPGAATSQVRPKGIGRRLGEPREVPGGVRHVSQHRFWTVPGSPQRVYVWLAHHPPRGTSASENYAGEVFWEHGPPGTLGATGVIAAVQSLDGETAVRADVFTGWELPRNPTERVPVGAHYLSLEVAPGSEGSREEGKAVPPVRLTSTERVSLIAALARLANRQPAFQLFHQPSCGPAYPAAESRHIVFRFEGGRNGKVLARLSQETPIGICDGLNLQVADRKPYLLEGGRRLLHRARDLIRRARPDPTRSVG